MIRYITGLLAFVFLSFGVRSQDGADMNRTVLDMDQRNVSLADVLHFIEARTAFRFNYKTEDISAVTGIYYQRRQVSVKGVLTDLLARRGLEFEQIGVNIIIRRAGKVSGLVRIYGFVKSAQSGEVLAGATVSVPGTARYHTVSNVYGFYSLTMPPGEYRIECTYIGFRDLERTVEVYQDMNSNIELTERSDKDLEAVVVAREGKKGIVRRPAMGSHTLDIAAIKRIPMAGGEPDVMKSLQLLPGIQASNEGTTNLSIRGGSYDQNLVLLDEAPVYNPSHTLGFFSTFNTDALKDVSVYKSIYPAQYGGRLSAVVDVRMKEGNSREQVVSGGIGLLASRLAYEGPLKKDKSSFLLSVRYSDIGVLLNAAQSIPLMKLRTNDSKVSFYDFNATFNPVLGNKDRLFLSGYMGHDNFYLDQIDRSNRMTWGNTTVSLRWNHVFNPGLFSNTSVLYSGYRFVNYNQEANSRYRWEGGLREVTLKTDMEWKVHVRSQVKFGVSVTGQEVSPGELIPGDSAAFTRAVLLKARRSVQVAGYIGFDQRADKRISFSYGFRATGFAALGDVVYMGTEPRATVRYLFGEERSLKLSIGRNYQFQHLLTNSSLGLPSDIWMPSNATFRPQYSDVVTAGGYSTIQHGVAEASVEVYYRRTNHVIDFKDNAEIFLNDKLETEVLTGRAKSYGVEMLFKKNKGLTRGWVSYTYSKSLRQIDGVNGDRWYPPGYDHRHNFSLVVNRAIGKRWTVSANWVFRSGGYTTVPVGSYSFGGIRWLYYSSRNGYLLPAYHRMDVSVSWQPVKNQSRKWQGEWLFSIYNLYNRENVFALYARQNEHNFSDIKVSMVYLTGILPTISYNFKF